ncbi:tRNA (cytosine-5-)-methyltransferase [Frankliniella fusca]|uniref:tRNA (cytosine(38)-C(5))-methyltransferase n=1 Tax=Frankliniella fusca TaxID=407009 RepID=A0AAE1GS86_9NEOP|nr:tRNA (cytosine-5-)-methyltransferase [Frankliniella fusca]
MRVLELYSGIGGMHYACKESGIPYEVIAAVDINTVANEVYLHNFPSSNLICRNIQSFTASEINKMAPDMILMSPPCQPFTRVGLQKDVSDQRTCSLLHFISALPHLKSSLRYILVENVKGFELSESRSQLIEALSKENFTFQEFLLNPMQFGIPNSRLRYYLLAKRLPLKFCFQVEDSVMTEFPVSKDNGSASKYTLMRLNKRYREMADADKVVEDEERVSSDGGVIHPPCFTLKRILEDENPESALVRSFLLPDKVLGKRSVVLDIVTPQSKRSCCFTKAYGHYSDGTGSVLTTWNMSDVHSIRARNKQHVFESDEQILEMKQLKLRYFSPREVARLMCFPEEPLFSFPDKTTTKQRYRLLGNSVNVHVISLLISIMTVDEIQ